MSVQLLTSDRSSSAGPLVPLEEKSIKSHSNASKGATGKKVSPSSEKNDNAKFLGNQDATLTFLHDTAVTYDEAELPKIQPYLLSPDAEVQKAAIDAMLVLGDAGAAPMLREASRQITDTDAAMEMLKAADYLELPPVDVKKMATLLKRNSSNGNKTTDSVPERHAMNAKERAKRSSVTGRHGSFRPDNYR